MLDPYPYMSPHVGEEGANHLAPKFKDRLVRRLLGDTSEWYRSSIYNLDTYLNAINLHQDYSGNQIRKAYLSIG